MKTNYARFLKARFWRDMVSNRAGGPSLETENFRLFAMEILLNFNHLLYFNEFRNTKIIWGFIIFAIYSSRDARFRRIVLHIERNASLFDREIFSLCVLSISFQWTIRFYIMHFKNLTTFWAICYVNIILILSSYLKNNFT